MNRLPADVDEDVRIAALLHDVLEDTDYTRADLLALGFSKRALDAVALVTKVAGDPRSYAGFIDDLLASGNRDALAVKFADMSENADPDRLARLAPELRARLEQKYTEPLQKLRAALQIDPS
jgi:(p)ppGpp synthase/HD superfamily hydrolase